MALVLSISLAWLHAQGDPQIVVWASLHFSAFVALSCHLTLALEVPHPRADKTPHACRAGVDAHSPDLGSQIRACSTE